MTRLLTIAVAIIAAWAALPAAAQDLKAALSGKTLVAGANQIVIKTDGSMTGTVGGDALTGTWSISGGTWCRNITAPKRLASDVCQKATIAGSLLTVFRDDGSKTEWTIK